MTEETQTPGIPTHWMHDPKQRARFWATAGEHGFTSEHVHLMFGVDSMKDYPGTLQDALALLNIGSGPARAHREAVALAWTHMIDPQGADWSITIREGIDGDAAVKMCNQASGLSKWLLAHGWHGPTQSGPIPHVPPGYHGVPQPGANTPAPPPAASSLPPVPGAAAPAIPAPPPATNIPPGTVQTTTTVTEMRITAPKGRAVVEFWQAGRQYPEMYWKLGGAKLLEIAPSLAALHYTAAHLDAVGQTYAIKLEIAWSVSPKNDKWKDIQAVRVIQ